MAIQTTNIRSILELDPNDPFVMMFFVPYDQFSQPITQNGKTFKEMLLPFCFNASIRRGQVYSLYGHDHRWPLGLQGVNLTIGEKRDGLRCRMRLMPAGEDSQMHVSILDAVSLGEMMVSPGFNVIKETWPRADVRLIADAELVELSLVRNPAYPKTSSCLTPPAKKGVAA